MRNRQHPRNSSIQAQRQRASTWTHNTPTRSNSSQDDLDTSMRITSWMMTSSYGSSDSSSDSSSSSSSSSSDSGGGGGE